MNLTHRLRRDGTVVDLWGRTVEQPTPALPFAVYGTLRTGQANAGWWRNAATSEGLGVVENFRLDTNGSFPYAIPTQGPAIVVELLTSDDLAALGESLDVLEGEAYDHYTRLVVTVRTDDGLVAAHMYVPTESTTEYAAEFPTIPSGDWTDR